jgi:hypothetical protein
MTTKQTKQDFDNEVNEARRALRVVNDRALADRLNRIADEPRRWSVAERRAILMEAASRLWNGGYTMNLHLYPVIDGFVVEEAETFRLLAHDESAAVAWGFTDNSDRAHVFATADEAAQMGQRWDPTLTSDRIAQ